MVIRNGWANAALGVCLTAFALVLASGTGVEKPAAAKAVLALAAVASLVLVVRAARAGLVVTQDDLEVRGYIRSNRYRWQEISGVKRIDSGNVTGQASCVGLTLTSGRVVKVRGAASYSRVKVERWCHEALHLAPPGAAGPSGP